MGMQTTGSAVLVVEDDPILRQDLVDQFHAAGWFVIAAKSAETALALCQQGGEIGIAVIGDDLAGNMDGLELARVLRAIGYQAPIVYVSESPVETGQMVPDSVHRPKPVAARDMAAILDALLAGEPVPLRSGDSR